MRKGPVLGRSWTNGGHIATFPDVITTLSQDMEPLSVGELEVGMKVHVLHVAKNLIPIGAGLLDPAIYVHPEKVMGINLTDYALGS